MFRRNYIKITFSRKINHNFCEIGNYFFHEVSPNAIPPNPHRKLGEPQNVYLKKNYVVVTLTKTDDENQSTEKDQTHLDDDKEW